MHPSTHLPLLPLLLSLPITTAFTPTIIHHKTTRPFSPTFVTTTTTTHLHSSSPLSCLKLTPALETLNALLPTTKLFPELSVTISSSPLHRHGLTVTRDVKAKQAVLSVPYDDNFILTADRARNILKTHLPKEYEGWTGDVGLVALLLLSEMASSPILETRKEYVKEFVKAWIETLPGADEMGHHPLFWSEDDQEVLQSSSTKKIYQLLDDMEEDATWLEERVWSQNRDIFPEKVGERDCFTPKGFVWAVAQVSSRAVFVDGMLRLIPVVDFANHKDGLKEIEGGFFGTFGTTKGVQILAPEGGLKKGQEVCVSYGPKNGIEYLLEYGFMPQKLKNNAASKFGQGFSELTYEVDEKDRFYEDKMDILEFETDRSPMNPVQTFDVGGEDGEPDPAMFQFLRLMKLGAMDAFLLESIFRQEVWDFMALPVSVKNEEAAVDGIIEACNKALNDMEEDVDGDEDYEKMCCKVVRDLEKRALSKTVDYMQREREALDLKEYYQERRLKDLGLESEWNEDEMNPDVGWGQTRAPGGGDW